MGEARTWFRLYTEFAFDPKVQLLDETLQRRYVMLLCAAAAGMTPFHAVSEAAFLLRIPVSECEKTRSILVSQGLITDDWWPIAWDKRQFQSDTSTARVKRFRQRQKGVTSTVTETPSEQSRAEQIQSRSEQSIGRTSEAGENRKGKEPGPDPAEQMRDCGSLARELRKLDVNVTSNHPLLVGWLQDGYTLDQCVQAVAVARTALGEQELIPAKYLDKVLRNPPKPAGNGRSAPPSTPRRLSTGEIIEQAILDGRSDDEIVAMPELAEWPTVRRDIREKRQEIAEHAGN